MLKCIGVCSEFFAKKGRIRGVILGCKYVKKVFTFRSKYV